MTWLVIGDREDLQLNVSSRARVVSGKGYCQINDDEIVPAPFNEVVSAQRTRCAWSIGPSGSSLEVPILALNREDGGFNLEIRWPDDKYLRAEQMLDHVYHGGHYSILLPFPSFRSSSSDPARSIGYAEFKMGATCTLSHETLPVLSVLV